MFRPISLLVLCAGLLPTPSVRAADGAQYLDRVRAELLIGPAAEARADLARIDDALARLETNPDDAGVDDARRAFADLVRHWKTAEAVYVAGVRDEAMLDHPRFIDHFHQGNESLAEQVERALADDRPLKQALFKSSTRSINALEYLLYAAHGSPGRRWPAARLAVANLAGWLGEIEDFYRGDAAFAGAGDASLEMLIHALVDSSFKLAHWRVGEPAGLGPRFEGRPDAARLEYGRSGLSLAAVTAILETHARVFDLGLEDGYFSAEGRAKGIEEIGFIRDRIGQALAQARGMSGGADVGSAAFAELHRRVETVYRAYYFLLVDAMGLGGKIVDADGD